MKSTFLRIAKATLGATAVAGVLIASAAAASADTSVYFRFGDGRVVRDSRSHWDRYRGQGATMVTTLPRGYVSEPYVTTGGAPVYYSQDYWHKHNRRWKGDKWQGNHNHHHHH